MSVVLPRGFRKLSFRQEHERLIPPPKRAESVYDITNAASKSYIILQRTGTSLYVFLFTSTGLKSMK
jgi:hypothetical protein